MMIRSQAHRGPVDQTGRYAILHQIGEGGMAAVHLARLLGPAGFMRVVALKQLHPRLCRDPELRAMFIREARLTSRIHHPNVVPILDVVVDGADIFLVMEYIEGEALSSLRQASWGAIPLPICSAIMIGALRGLHAAHEARGETGELLDVVHRDVSPANILVGVDGISRVIDFGVAKAGHPRQETRPGVLKGKSSYMAPEQIRGEKLTRRTDIFAASVVLWELLTSRRLFAGATEGERMGRILRGEDVVPPSNFAAHLPAALADIVMKGLSPDPGQRHATASDMADAIELTVAPASPRIVGAWVTRTAAKALSRRAELLERIDVSDITVREIPSDKGAPSPIARAAAVALGRGSSWQDRRAFLGGAGAAVVLLVSVVVLSRGRPPLPPPREPPPPPPITAVAPQPDFSLVADGEPFGETPPEVDAPAVVAETADRDNGTAAFPARKSEANAKTARPARRRAAALRGAPNARASVARTRVWPNGGASEASLSTKAAAGTRSVSLPPDEVRGRRAPLVDLEPRVELLE